MKSPFCQWLTDLSEIAEKEGITVEAKYYDGLIWFFQIQETPESALPKYKNLVRRSNAIVQETSVCQHTGARFNPRPGEVVCSHCLEQLE